MPLKRCPKCGARCQEDAVLCVRCGVNLRTGLPARAHSNLADEEGLTTGVRLMQWLGEWAPAVLRPWVLIASILVSLVGLAAMGLGLMLFIQWGVWISGIAIAAAGLIVYAHGPAWFLVGEICLIHDALMDLEGRKAYIFAALASLPVIIPLAAYGLMKGVRR